MTKRNKRIAALVCGLLGCLCFGAGDWLMLYGDPAYTGKVYWLTEGVRHIPQWRFDISMALALPGIVLYGIALFAVQDYIKSERERTIYHYLNAFGLTPWLALHLFVVMVLCLWSFSGDLALATELRDRLNWFVFASEAMMLPVFLYWFYLQISGRTVFPKWFAWTSVLVFYALLSGVKTLLPVSAFRLGFTNGLMSESMILWFGCMLLWERRTEA
ncbi:MAG: hypothetical protein E7425_14215 [Ruminococcaceae bacterium]|jgi:hypothetical protein|nr:hypothetical protein [Oscillospiraceae bacterium]